MQLISSLNGNYVPSPDTLGDFTFWISLSLSLKAKQKA